LPGAVCLPGEAEQDGGLNFVKPTFESQCRLNLGSCNTCHDTMHRFPYMLSANLDRLVSAKK
ncbi:MAG TPA: hypothetical protein VD772_07700, partial [Anseongella sp.]|nr:hypothetical protein [Anseongella sp.]